MSFAWCEEDGSHVHKTHETLSNSSLTIVERIVYRFLSHIAGDNLLHLRSINSVPTLAGPERLDDMSQKLV